MKFFVLIFLGMSCLVNAQTKPSAPVANDKIGYVDIDNVIAQLPEYKKLETKLQETRKKMSDDLFDKQQAFDRAYSYYMQNARDLADTTRTRLEGELEIMNTEMQEFSANAERTFENTKKLYLAPVYLRLGEVIRSVAIEHGFSMILPYRVGSGELLLHSDAKLDISQLVIAKLSSK
jgi:outer membrane protein